jgi:hypothetical protein
MYGTVLLLWWGNVNEKDHLEDLDVERRTILREIFKTN